ncbi:hypothetical protein DFP72DRAFT_910661 [Ephemerocybe angulata]|uniref:Uncharacterized protein n=1 Tax=Ephemerocybe angulata TaxID=980116 RepID=A0A8H6HNI2_9AGAR|nr:hypothetical protein DFP72DRAFT_910646 [Tulosesus angulatus]KAF6750298.1 hypothetical protein DFP72DRAFT_910661 [Tulosesus angulatus]
MLRQMVGIRLLYSPPASQYPIASACCLVPIANSNPSHDLLQHHTARRSHLNKAEATIATLTRSALSEVNLKHSRRTTDLVGPTPASRRVPTIDHSHHSDARTDVAVRLRSCCEGVAEASASTGAGRPGEALTTLPMALKSCQSLTTSISGQSSPILRFPGAVGPLDAGDAVVGICWAGFGRTGTRCPATSTTPNTTLDDMRTRVPQLDVFVRGGGSRMHCMSSAGAAERGPRAESREPRDVKGGAA